MKTEKLILGTVQFGMDYGINNKNGRPDSAEIEKILDHAFESGIGMLDTAERYGNSQQSIGDYHRGRDCKFDLITKLDFSSIKSEEELNQRVEGAINKLNVSGLYCCMFHTFSALESNYSNHESAFQKLITDKKVAKLGVSLHSNAEFEQALAYDIVSIIQLPFNLFDNENSRGNMLRKARDQGIEIHVRSVFLQGLFFKDPESISYKLQPFLKYLRLLGEIAKDCEMSINQLALSYVMMQEDIDKVLIGVDNQSQLIENIENADFDLPSDVIEEINTINMKDNELLNPANWS
ncbi:MAG: aldo/keto reductase [Colwellia sp.]|nr:aldo/keto reductase [Colwellia sp.]